MEMACDSMRKQIDSHRQHVKNYKLNYKATFTDKHRKYIWYYITLIILGLVIFMEDNFDLE